MRKFLLYLVGALALLGVQPAWADGLIDLRVDAETLLECGWKHGEWVCSSTVYSMYSMGVSPGLENAPVTHRIIGNGGAVLQELELFTVTTDAAGPNCPNPAYCTPAGEPNGASFETCSAHGACAAAITCPDGWVTYKTGTCNSWPVGIIPGCGAWACLCGLFLPEDPCAGHRAGSPPGMDPWQPLPVLPGMEGMSVQLAPCGANTPFDTETGQCEGQGPCLNCDPNPTNNSDN